VNNKPAEISINKMYTQWQADKKSADTRFANTQFTDIESDEIMPGEAAVAEDPAQDSAVQTVLRIFDGTIINGDQNEH
jgi:hypothetical protein